MIYRFSGTYRTQFLVCGLLGVGLFLLISWLALSRSPPKDAGEAIIVTALLTGCALGSGYLLWLYRYLGSHILLAENGISQVSPNGSIVSIRWDEITEIKRRTFNQRTEVIAAKADKSIRIEHQIGDFLELQNVINERAPISHEEIHSFNIAVYPLIVIGSMGMLMLIVGLMGFARSQSGSSFFIALMGLVGVSATLFQMRSVTVGDDAVRIKYPLWTKTIPLRGIGSIGQSQVSGKYGARFNAVVIRLKSGKEIKILNVKEGDDRLYGRLKAVVGDAI